MTNQHRLSEIYGQEYMGKIFYYCLRKTGDSHEAEDLASDITVQVLTALHADVLICGGIGGGAQMALAAAGIQLFGGVSGSADAAVEAFLAGQLSFNPDASCHHHDHDHDHDGECCGHHDHDHDHEEGCCH